MICLVLNYTSPVSLRSFFFLFLFSLSFFVAVFVYVYIYMYRVPYKQSSHFVFTSFATPKLRKGDSTVVIVLQVSWYLCLILLVL